MGHERVGTLPRTQRWRSVVGGIADCAGGDCDVSGVAAQTLDHVRQRFRYLSHDEGTKAAFRFLVELAIASRSGLDTEQLVRLQADPNAHPTPLKLATALRLTLEQVGGNPEYKAIAESAAVDALVLWYREHQPQQQSLFGSFDTAEEIWREAGSGAGFCELSRLFFAKCTERYLSYFLEREASYVLPTVEERTRFGEAVTTHVDEISQHAFETSKIAQSYAAGWFNKFAVEGVPSEAELNGFLSYAFGKLRDELSREGLDR